MNAAGAPLRLALAAAAALAPGLALAQVPGSAQVEAGLKALCLNASLSVPALERKVRTNVPLAGGQSIQGRPLQARGSYYVGEEKEGFYLSYVARADDAARLQSCSVGVYTTERTALVDWLTSSLPIEGAQPIKDPVEGKETVGLLGRVTSGSVTYKLAVEYTELTPGGRQLVLLNLTP